MPVSETTPLLAVVQVAPRRHRYPHHALRRACTFALGAVLLVAVVLFLSPVAILPREHGSLWSYLPWAHPFPHKSWPHGDGLSYHELQSVLYNTPTPEKLREWSVYYTAGPHLAGGNFSQAVWTQEKWKEFGVEDTRIVAYDVYLNYPVDHRLALLKKSGDDDFDVTFEATLEEDVLEEDRTSGLPNRVPTFHGYSASGNVTAQYVYANFGSYEDFEDLRKANVSVEGKIVIVKYGGLFRGLKVKRAQELGAVGVIIYSDPQEDGEITELNGYKAYPEGPARNPSAVQRGSVQFLSISPGDPTTPGYASKPNVERQDPHERIPSIPSIPISYKEALPLLKALNGHGPKASDFNKYWQGGGLAQKGVEYNVGPSPEDVVINLYNQQNYVTTPLWNVIGVIKGSIPDEVVILGNHRDAWIAGGAGDPNSGSAALNEVVRSFGEALKAGWKPLRTIVFASWDGEEYGLVGSTEWVEDNLPWLSKTNVVYLNVDGAATGTRFSASASPLLNKALFEATGLVQSPNQTVEGQTVRDVWGGHISTLGSGSDYTAFQDFAGISSVSFGFSSGPGDAVYHYHSNYDSFDWMDRFGDPGWVYHLATTRIFSLLAAHLVETPVLALNATDYATGLQSYLDRLKPRAAANVPGFSFSGLEDAISTFRTAAVSFDAYAADLTRRLGEHVPWYHWWKKVRLFFEIRAVNDKYKLLERKFLYEGGLDGRSWFKHVVFAPGLWTGYAGATYPGLVESFDAGDVENAERWGAIIEERIRSAAAALN
ncbi:Glutamate carboxypeptidase II [Rasamsonia emersonii CBS 393.64]|uniref:Glutamate carboxypeptidase II n=1 Tax=Rasamsonia emersonii (strain ATCC 16479 / CBS 393.64 / IMI 116815) TaxID=1408163 RepID=A0A0F4YN19_RASE3|nr:Glutamate carboxypeptidase II [Rasamsonia emersonii CBS 393.64]KKA19647.1 Glutamate carboxypeptidase II [Rasamsonia emersonii CBS 393.64]